MAGVGWEWERCVFVGAQRPAGPIRGWPGAKKTIPGRHLDRSITATAN